VVFGAVYTLCTLLGGIIPSGSSFAAVDLSVGAMTVINVVTLLLCRREITEGTEFSVKAKKRSG
jgi:Na+/alanine symporter